LLTRGTGRVLALPAIAGWLRISGMKRLRIFGTDSFSFDLIVEARLNRSTRSGRPVFKKNKEI
jgi:hypothetical protein